jgi:hypothetical protein
MYLCNKLCLDASKFSKIFDFFLGTEGLRLIQKPYYDLYYLYLIFRSTQSKASKIEGYNNTSARIVERLPAKKSTGSHRLVWSRSCDQDKHMRQHM